MELLKKLHSKNIFDIDVSAIDIPTWAENLLNVLREHNLSAYMHSVDVSLLMYAVATELALDSEMTANFYYAGLFHDIGKICIPNTILDSPKRLTPCDREIVDYHSYYGASLLSKFNNYIVNGVLYHHVPYNNEHGDDLIASAIHVVDVFDAIHEKRPYAPPVNEGSVIDYLQNKVITEFSPFYVGVLHHVLSNYTFILNAV